MSYQIAGIDVHKRMLAVVVSDVELRGEYQFERRWLGASPDQCPAHADGLGRGRNQTRGSGRPGRSPTTRDSRTVT